MGRSRLALFYSLMISLTALAVAALFELGVRLLVPAETFWPVSNIYRPVEIPGLGYTFKPNLSGIAFGVDLETNSLGFRGPEWSREKRPGVYRIALVGDSFAFGFGVPFGDSVGEVLSRILSERHGVPVEVLNFGVNGFNAAQQRAVVESSVLDHHPDLLILMPTNNDHEGALAVDGEGWLHSGPTEDDSRIVDRSIIEVEVESVSWWMQHSRLLLYLKLLQNRYAFRSQAQTRRPLDGEMRERDWMDDFEPGPPSDRIQNRVEPPLRKTLAIARKARLPVVIAAFFGEVDYRRLLRRLSQEEAVPVLELPALFPEAHSFEELLLQFGLGWNDHLNAAAHKRWAIGIADLLDRVGCGPGSPRCGGG